MIKNIFTLWFIHWRAPVAMGTVAALILVSRPAPSQARTQSDDKATPTSAAVVKVKREDLSDAVAIDAELRPYQEISLHAKVSGYLEDIKVDIGDAVKPGQLLATIEVPELKDDIQRAEAEGQRDHEEVGRAQAVYDEDHLVYTRLMGVVKAKPNLVAQQEIDAAMEKERTAASALAAAKAQVEVAKAELNKLRTMQSYCRITAPFAGVITERSADPGALIPAGTSSGGAGSALVRLSENDRLRLDIPVSVSYAPRVKVGDPVEVEIASLNRKFSGAVARTSRKVDTATRTLEVEVDVPNKDLSLLPGMYATATLRLETRPHTLVVPVQAVSRGHTTSVLLLNKENKIEERPVQIGLETPSKLEVVSGLQENDMVVIGSRSQFRPGQVVQPKLMDLAETH